MIFKLGDIEVLKENDSYVYSEFLKKYINTKCYMSIVVTNSCNRACPYCINSKSDSNLELPFDKAVINAKKAHNLLGIQECVILGGEPTLYSHLVPLVEQLSKIGFKKVVMTTNGVNMTEDFLSKLITAGLTHLNVSVHNDNGEFATIGLEKMQKIYQWAKKQPKKIPVRINTNVWKGNHDKCETLVDWLNTLQYMSDTIRVSNIIKKDDFSVNPENNDKTFDMMHTNDYYNQLFDELIDYYSQQYSLINNSTALGFVDYTMVPMKSAIIINRNIDSKVSKQVCENEEAKVNTVKLLVSGDLSLSWNTHNLINL
jgi:molybdenum cofactor biosynthesis enzyme MoaA